MVKHSHGVIDLPSAVHAHAEGAGVVRCEEVCLRLADDGEQLVLSRYFELYSPNRTVRSERAYSVPLASLLDWMMEQGERRFDSSAGGRRPASDALDG